MAVNLDNPTDLRGATVTGDQGVKLGRVDNVYLDDQTGRAEWAAVKTGMWGGHVSLVPLAAADYQNSTLHLPYTKDQVQNAPHHDPDQELSVQDEQELFTHYGVAYEGATATAQQGAGDQRRDRTDDPGVVGHDVSGPTTDEAMTRAEEELRVGTQTREAGRVRLRKYVVTETETHTVPVSREEVRLEREPITESTVAAATDGPTISEEEHEVVLHEERPVVQKQTVPKERVRLGKETERDQEQVSEQVRKEQIDTTSEAGQSETGRSGPPQGRGR